MRYVIAVDPGLTGALAVFHSGGQLINVIDMPTEQVGDGFVKRQVCAVSLRRALEEYVQPGERWGDWAHPGMAAVVERVTAMPGQGVSSMLSLGDSRGTLRGVFGALGIPMTEVLPQRWKKDLGLIEYRKREQGAPVMTKQEKNERQKRAKAASVAMVKKEYPAHAYMVERAKDHNRAEAVLIGRWAVLEREGKL